MPLGALIGVQLVFDVLLVLLPGPVARQGRAPAAPPAWHDEFLQLAREVMAVADALLEPWDRAPAPVAPAPPAPARAAGTHSRDEAFTLLRAGAAAEDIARR